MVVPDSPHGVWIPNLILATFSILECLKHENGDRATGTFNTEGNASGSPSGVYFHRLQNG